MDFFGTKYTFYSNKRPRLYTKMGGILSLISILFCILISIIFTLDDLRRVSPITTISSIPSIGYRKIKFGDEKIWIPWRIVDYNNNQYVNHTGLLFPIIYYIYGSKNNETKKMDVQSTKINYKLCNETSMAFKNDIYKIKIPLSELYCIDMDELDMGGSWITEFINYVQFDLYYCEDGINYDETNQKCTSYNEIINFIGQSNSLTIEFYYPIVQFQPTNIKKPVIVIYRQHFFHLSKYTSKIERIFLQENVLTDDLGWIVKNEINNSYWGLNVISGDNYFKGEGKDLMNEGSNSRAYSFNIYLEPGIIHYKRYYKKFFSILADALPLAFIIFSIFKGVSKFFKFAEGNKKMFELLFENLNEKTNHFEKIKKKNSLDNIRKLSFNIMNRDDMNIKKGKKSKISLDLSFNKKGEHRHSLIMMNKKRNTLISFNNLNSLKNKKLSMQMKKNNYNNSNLNLILNDSTGAKDNANHNNYIPFEKVKKNQNLKTHSEKTIFQFKNNITKQKLFPYKYYLFSVFIKNLNISKKNYFFSARFAKVYMFLCQLFDVTTYLILQREFSSLKNILKEKNIRMIENYDKININSKNFLKDINHCIGDHKFNILSQGNKKKNDILDFV
jgi:hypothetical protein